MRGRVGFRLDPFQGAAKIDIPAPKEAVTDEACLGGLGMRRYKVSYDILRSSICHGHFFEEVKDLCS